MDIETLRSWLDAYGDAWEARDPRAAADLFAEDATYQETPFDEPMRGRPAIAAYWADVPLQQDRVGFGYEVLAVEGDRGIARWRASFVRVPEGTRARLDGILLVSLDPEGRCEVFREWWHRQDDKPE